MLVAAVLVALRDVARDVARDEACVVDVADGGDVAARSFAALLFRDVQRERLVQIELPAGVVKL